MWSFLIYSLAITALAQDIDNDLPDCYTPCQLGTTDTLSKRRLNESDTEGLTRRVFKFPGRDGLVERSDRPTEEVIGKYLYNQVPSGTYDDQYGPFRGLFNMEGYNEAAVSDQDVFGDANWQIGSDGIHGCQIVTVISPKGAWMAHFWESYTNGFPESDEVTTGPSVQAFDERMTYFLTNQAVTNPGPGVYTRPYPDRQPTLDHPYLQPLNKPLNRDEPWLQNDNNGADIRVFIATPKLYQNRDTLKYKQRINRIRSALKSYLGSRINIMVYGYTRLNQGDKVTENSPRGLYALQYDANADGKGNARWRLFYEDSLYTGTAIKA